MDICATFLYKNFLSLLTTDVKDLLGNSLISYFVGTSVFSLLLFPYILGLGRESI